MCAQWHDWGDTAGSCVSVEKPRCSVCVPCVEPLHISAHYSPGERALSVIVLKPTQPLMLSHASSQISLTHSLTHLAKDLDSHRFSSPLDLSDFVGLHRSGHLPFLSVDVYTSSVMKYDEALYLQSLLWVIYSHFRHTLNSLSHSQKFSDMINVYINFKDVSSLLK